MNGVVNILLLTSKHQCYVNTSTMSKKENIQVPKSYHYVEPLSENVYFFLSYLNNGVYVVKIYLDIMVIFAGCEHLGEIIWQDGYEIKNIVACEEKDNIQLLVTDGYGAQKILTFKSQIPAGIKNAIRV
jgi:hypothetical protein